MSFNIQWDKQGEREYEIGVSRGVLFPMSNGAYESGVAWNGLTGVDENPDGGEINDIFADNIKYASFQTPENQKGTITAYMFPDEFYPCNGQKSPSGMPGLTFGGQTRKSFGMCYRTEIGTDTDEAAGYKLHFLYNNKVKPSSRSHTTKTENVEPEEMSWDYSSTPVPVTGVDGVEQTSIVEVKSTDFTDDQMAALEAVVYGTAAVAADAINNIEAVAAVPARLPDPGEIYTILRNAAPAAGGGG